MKPVLKTAAFALLLTFSTALASAAEAPKLDSPVVITSVGQAPDGYAVSMVAKRSKIPVEYETLLKPEEVSKFKSMIISFGVSLKGFGAAGVNLDTETERGAALIKAARDNNVKLIGLHTGGEGRRDVMSNSLLEKYADKMDYFIVFEAGDKDGFFKKLEADKKIPVVRLDAMGKIKGMLEQMFQ